MSVLVNRAQRAFFRLELADALRSRWLTFIALVYGVVFGAFIWLGLRESSVLGFTGLSRVVLNLSNAIVVVLPLVALIATTQTVVRARSSGYFELFLAGPCRPGDWLKAVLASRLLVLAGPLLALLFVTLIVGHSLGEEGLAALVVRSLLVALALVWCFVGIGLWLSSVARSSERATIYALLTWLLVTALHDFALIGTLLQTRLLPGVVFTLAASNPAEAGRLAMLSGIDPELSVLGPVGFWVANSLGPRVTLLVGVAWPVLLGTCASLLAMRRLKHSDLVG